MKAEKQEQEIMREVEARRMNGRQQESEGIGSRVATKLINSRVKLRHDPHGSKGLRSTHMQMGSAIASSSG